MNESTVVHAGVFAGAAGWIGEGSAESPWPPEVINSLRRMRSAAESVNTTAATGPVGFEPADVGTLSTAIDALNYAVGATDQDERPEPLAPRLEAAFRSFEYAERILGHHCEAVTDRAAFDWIREHGIEGYDPPPNFETWQRYVRHGRKYYGSPKECDQEDAGPSTPRSAVPSSHSSTRTDHD